MYAANPVSPAAFTENADVEGEANARELDAEAARQRPPHWLLRLHAMLLLRGGHLFELLGETKHLLPLGDKGNGSGDLP